MLNYNNNLPYGLKLIGYDVVRKYAQVSSKDAYDFIKTLAARQINRPDPTIVPVYKFRNIGFNRGTYKYYYEMMRLGMISKEEKEIINCAGNECDCGRFNIANSNHATLVNGRKSYPSLVRFLEEITFQNRYWDLHSGNILIDEDRNYRLIDLEGFIKLPFKDKKNDWLTQ
jgi:hypothetical protein